VLQRAELAADFVLPQRHQPIAIAAQELGDGIHDRA
jgi:hypothetical protein